MAEARELEKRKASEAVKPRRIEIKAG